MRAFCALGLAFKGGRKGMSSAFWYGHQGNVIELID
jgi:hypothetical protein